MKDHGELREIAGNDEKLRRITEVYTKSYKEARETMRKLQDCTVAEKYTLFLFFKTTRKMRGKTCKTETGAKQAGASLT